MFTMKKKGVSNTLKIESASIYMSSVSSQRMVSHTSENLRIWGDSPLDIQDSTVGGDNLEKQLNQELLEKFKATNSTTTISQTATDPLPIPKKDELKIRLMNLILDKLIQKKLKFLIPQASPNQPIASSTYSLPSVMTPIQNLQGWGLDYQKSEYYSETEAMNFNSSGIVKTTDGKEIRIGINLTVQRSFVTQSLTTIKAGDALIDPLVINYGCSSASLTQNKFSFDLDNDGKSDSISFATGGSGFLAFDKNNDGVINNGSELFGPGSGNGFLELSQLDSDGNNWIDENDPIYDKLRIWTKDENGNDQLFAIGQKGIGAIYLGSIDSSYTLKDRNNSTQGVIRKTGLFLRENGTAGTIQHLDISL